ncbi:MAG: DUF86 domain-containing protein [Desulfosudis oleivorans]|nr:DUF86 domain-containing protein [Desulfosudis oleivorans]
MDNPPVIAAAGLGVVDWYSDRAANFHGTGPAFPRAERTMDPHEWFHRGTLVRGYNDIDRTIVYEVLRNGLRDIGAFQRALARGL